MRRGGEIEKGRRGEREKRRKRAMGRNGEWEEEKG